MKLVSFLENDEDRVAIYHDGYIYPLADIDPELPDNMQDLLWDEEAMEAAKAINEGILEADMPIDGTPVDEAELISPVPFPTSCRDAYAFRQHVAAARRNRGVEMIPEFDQFPVFYFTNHNAVFGPGEVYLMPDHFNKLDFELEIAAVIGKQGRNVRAGEADEYIAGFMIMNDFSARALQMEEMKLNLGPAKGKDFGNSFGPWLVTPDELKNYLTKAKEGHTGNSFGLKMKAWYNGELVSEGSVGDMDWTFAEIIERVSYGIDIFPGDVIGSGTVGTGCFLELNGTKKRENPDYEPRWIQPGDEIEMEIEGLGKLKNTFLKEETDYSLLSLKKEIKAGNA